MANYCEQAKFQIVPQVVGQLMMELVPQVVALIRVFMVKQVLFSDIE